MVDRPFDHILPTILPFTIFDQLLVDQLLLLTEILVSLF